MVVDVVLVVEVVVGTVVGTVAVAEPRRRRDRDRRRGIASAGGDSRRCADPEGDCHGDSRKAIHRCPSGCLPKSGSVLERRGFHRRRYGFSSAARLDRPSARGRRRSSHRQPRPYGAWDTMLGEGGQRVRRSGDRRGCRRRPRSPRGWAPCGRAAREASVVRAVMRDLEHVHGPWIKRHGLGLGIRGEEHREAVPPRQQHEGQAVRIRGPGSSSAARGGHRTSRRRAPESPRNPPRSSSSVPPRPARREGSRGPARA